MSINKFSKNYKKSKLPRKCFVCGYDKYIEVCHIIGISTFNENTLITQINSIDNLIALCPNCHWEFDHGLLKLSKWEDSNLHVSINLSTS